MFCVKMIMSLIVATSPYPNSPNIYKISKRVCAWSEVRKLDPHDVLALIRHESSFNRRLVSKTGDYGLMQVNKKYSRARCNLLKIGCNIKEGTRQMALWRYACLNQHKHRRYNHWLRHYNWNSRNHHLHILWVSKAYKSGNPKLLKIIKNRGYTKFRISYRCLKEGYCGAI